MVTLRSSTRNGTFARLQRDINPGNNCNIKLPTTPTMPSKIRQNNNTSSQSSKTTTGNVSQQIAKCKKAKNVASKKAASKQPTVHQKRDQETQQQCDGSKFAHGDCKRDIQIVESGRRSCEASRLSAADVAANKSSPADKTLVAKQPETEPQQVTTNIKVAKRRGRPPGKKASSDVQKAKNALKSNQQPAGETKPPRRYTSTIKSHPQEAPSKPSKRGRKKRNRDIDDEIFLTNTQCKILSNLVVQKLIEKVSISLEEEKAESKQRILDLSELKLRDPNNAFISILTNRSKDLYGMDFVKESLLKYPDTREWEYFMMKKPIDWIANINLRHIMPPMPSLDGAGYNMRRRSKDSVHDSAMNLISKLNENTLHDKALARQSMRGSNTAGQLPDGNVNTFRIAAPSCTLADGSFSGTQSAQQIDGQLLIGRVCSPPRSKSECRQSFAPDLRALAEMLHKRSLEGDSNELGPNCRPPFSMATLVYMALLKAGQRGAQSGVEVREICKWISDNFSYYRESTDNSNNYPNHAQKQCHDAADATPVVEEDRANISSKSTKKDGQQKPESNLYGTVKSTLTSNKCFQRMSKLKRGSGSRGRGCFWRLDPTYSTISIYKQFYDAEHEQFQNDFYSLYCGGGGASGPSVKTNLHQNNPTANYNNKYGYSATEYLGENYINQHQYNTHDDHCMEPDFFSYEDNFPCSALDYHLNTATAAGGIETSSSSFDYSLNGLINQNVDPYQHHLNTPGCKYDINPIAPGYYDAFDDCYDGGHNRSMSASNFFESFSGQLML